MEAKLLIYIFILQKKLNWLTQGHSKGSKKLSIFRLHIEEKPLENFYKHIANEWYAKI